MSFGALQAMLPTLRQPGKVMIIGSSSARVVAPGRMAGFLWPPTPRSTGEDFSLAGSISKRGSAGIPCARPSPPKLFAFGRVPHGARPLPASLGFGSASSFRPLWTS
jgi:hypothetical protein